jgi:hypothetical protein
MHSRSGNLQSVRIMPPPLTESYSFISSIFSSSTGDTMFPDTLFLVTDSSNYSHNSVPVLPYPNSVLFSDLLFPITSLHYPITDLRYPGPISPYPRLALFSLIPTLFFPTRVLFFPITDPCYSVTTLCFLELVSPYPIADPNPLVSTFLCSSMHTCAQPN